MAGDTFVRSMLGPQVNSTRKSAPVYGFGSSTREHAAKIFLSSEHAALAFAGQGSPGPAGYVQKSTVGPQADGRFVSYPQWAFGSAQRFPAAGKTSSLPGPGEYVQRSSIGAQVNGTQPSQPIYGMGSSTRESVKKVYISDGHSNSVGYGMHSPGPASYSLKGAVGKQDQSPKTNQPAWVFGSNKRFRDPDILRRSKLPAPGA